MGGDMDKVIFREAPPLQIYQNLAELLFTQKIINHYVTEFSAVFRSFQKLTMMTVYDLNDAEKQRPKIQTIGRVADPDPVGSGVFAWIRIRFRFSNFSGSGSGSCFQIFWIRICIRFQPRFWKIAERSLKVIYQKKT